MGASHDGHCPLMLPRANFLGSRASTALTYCRVNINFSFPTLVLRKTNRGKHPSSPFLRLHFNLPPSLPASQPLGGARAAGAAEGVGARCVRAPRSVPASAVLHLPAPLPWLGSSRACPCLRHPSPSSSPSPRCAPTPVSDGARDGDRELPAGLEPAQGGSEPLPSPGTGHRVSSVQPADRGPVQPWRARGWASVRGSFFQRHWVILFLGGIK